VDTGSTRSRASHHSSARSSGKSHQSATRRDTGELDVTMFGKGTKQESVEFSNDVVLKQTPITAGLQNDDDAWSNDLILSTTPVLNNDRPSSWNKQMTMSAANHRSPKRENGQDTMAKSSLPAPTLPVWPSTDLSTRSPRSRSRSPSPSSSSSSPRLLMLNASGDSGRISRTTTFERVQSATVSFDDVYYEEEEKEMQTLNRDYIQDMINESKASSLPRSIQQQQQQQQPPPQDRIEIKSKLSNDSLFMALQDGRDDSPINTTDRPESALSGLETTHENDSEDSDDNDDGDVDGDDDDGDLMLSYSQSDRVTAGPQLPPQN